MAKDVAITFEGEMSALKGSLDGAQSHIRGWGDVVKGIGVAAFAGWITGKFLSEFGSLFSLSSAQIQVETKLASVIKATGGAAGFTADQFKQMASDMQATTLFGDEAILNGQAILATFKEIKGDVFKDTTAAMLDMATVLGTDLKGAATQLGKALNDPTKGMSALADAGVGFTTQQQEMIKKLQESGDMVGAQRVILAELESQFKGAATAAAEASGGGLTQLGTIFGEIKETIGMGLLTVLDAFVPLLKQGAALALDWADNFKELGPILSEGVGRALQFVTGAFGILYDIGSTVLTGLSSLWTSVFGDSATVAVNGVMSFVADAFTFMLEFGVGFFTALQVGFKNIPEVAEFAWTAVQLGAVTLFEDLKYFFTDTGPELVRWFADNWSEIFTDIFNFTGTVIANMWTNITEFFKGVWSWLSGGEGGFEWVGLTDGFESTLKELPNIVERQMTETEKALSAKAGQQGAALAGAFQEQYKKNMEALGFGDAKSPEAAKQTAAVTAAGLKTPSAPAAAEEEAKAVAAGKGGGAEKGGFKAGFEDLGSLFKRIQTSAASGGSPEAKAAEKTAKAAEKGAEASNKAAQKTEDVATILLRIEQKIGTGGGVAVLG